MENQVEQNLVARGVSRILACVFVYIYAHIYVQIQLPGYGKSI